MSGIERIVVRFPADPTGAVALIREAPVDAAPLFLNVRPDQVPALARAVYAICGEAHGQAAERAIDAARGIAPSTETLANREAALWMEVAREHGLRIALDWPRAIDAAPDHATARAYLARVRSAKPAVLSALIAETVTGVPPARWLALDTTGALRTWAEATNSVAARLIAARLGDPPDLPPLPEEEGSAVARNADHPLLALALPKGSVIARHTARLIDLCRIPARIAALRAGEITPMPGVSPEPGTGRATIVCSRGALTHEVRLSGERIESYRIDPPTWRLFAHDGVVAGHLQALIHRPERERRRAAEALILALDPCVETVIEGA